MGMDFRLDCYQQHCFPVLLTYYPVFIKKSQCQNATQHCISGNHQIIAAAIKSVRWLPPIAENDQSVKARITIPISFELK